MNFLQRMNKQFLAFGIVFLCFGYFAAYVPYSMMTKMITRGLFEGMNGQGLSGFYIVPTTVMGSFISMFFFITIMGWWKYAKQSKVGAYSVPRPRWYTLISGLCTSGVIVTTTLAYTFDGISIVFAMLLMRGGVLALAPIVDTIAMRRKRKIYWPSWVAAGLSFGALLVAFLGKGGTAMTVVAAVDISLYLLSYFVRLYFMSNYAKSQDINEKKAYFTEEQMVANPALFAGLFLVGLVGSFMEPGSIPHTLWLGFTEFPSQGMFWTTLLIGMLSYGTGLFGSLIFLDQRENTFTVPANRSSSIMSGVIATWLLSAFFGQRPISVEQYIGVGLIIGAIFFLAYRSKVEKAQKKSQSENERAAA